MSPRWSTQASEFFSTESVPLAASSRAWNRGGRQHAPSAWQVWNCSVPLEVLLDPHRSLVRSVLRYVESIQTDATITVLIPQIIPNKRRHEVLHNQRARLLESVLKARTDGVVIATLPFHIND